MKASERRERLADSRLYVVSDARRERGDLAEFLDSILGAGVDIVQIREKEAEAGDLLRWGMVFKEAAEAHGALFIVNDRPDVALALDADGVHLGQDDLPVEVARRILGPDAVIGVSSHSPEQFDAVSMDADYLCAGPVWETPTKPGRPAAGLDLIRHAAKSGQERPWFAIGGINQDNLPEVIDAGASRVVVVRAVTAEENPGFAAWVLRTALEDELAVRRASVSLDGFIPILEDVCTLLRKYNYRDWEDDFSAILALARADDRQFIREIRRRDIWAPNMGTFIDLQITGNVAAPHQQTLTDDKALRNLTRRLAEEMSRQRIAIDVSDEYLRKQRELDSTDKSPGTGS